MRRPGALVALGVVLFASAGASGAEPAKGPAGAVTPTSATAPPATTTTPTGPTSADAAPDDLAIAAPVALPQADGAQLNAPEKSTLPEHAQVLAMTVSGGVSLGSFEAGQLYLLAEALRRSPGAARLMISTGASAGSANALIVATDACHSSATGPEDSLGYRVWVPVGLDQLFDPERVTAQSMFVSDGLKHGVDTIAQSWTGLPSDCQFVAAIAATRANAMQVELTDGLVVPRQSERFIFRVEGRNNIVPRLTNYIDPKRNFERPLLPFSNGADLTLARDTAAVANAAMASAAFPVAFPEHVVPHCLTPVAAQFGAAPKEPLTCETPTRHDGFVDGGVFDNNPLGVSYQIARNGLYLDGETPTFRAVPTGPKEPRPEVIYGFVDPDLARYPLYMAPAEEGEKSDPLLSVLARFSDQAMSTARGQELATLAERNPLSLKRLWLIEASYPPISGLLGAFFGFFERDFRDFDFQLGQYDTFVELREHMGSVLGTGPYVAALQRDFAGPANQVPSARRKFACMLSHFEPASYSHLSASCEGDELRNFRVLLQVTLDRLWSNCRKLQMSATQSDKHPQCAAAQHGAASPVVDKSLRVLGERYQTDLESDFDYSIRILGDYEFHFKDLGLAPNQATQGRIAVRRKLADMVEGLANAQPSMVDRTLIMTGGRTAVNAIAYEPPKDRVYGLLGTMLAVGSLHRIGGLSSLYFNPDVRLSNLRTLITDRAESFSVTPSLGVEWAILPLSGSFAQFSVGLRAGYQMAGNDSLGANTCTATSVDNGDPRGCSQFVLHTPVNLTLFERVRLSATPLFYPVPESFGHKVFDLQLGLGAEFF